MIENMNNKLIEDLSNQLHIIWSNWFKYQRDNSTPENLQRWNKQSNTDYINLTNEDKEKDRILVKKHLLNIIKDYTNE